MKEYEILVVTEINDAVHQKAREYVKEILSNYNSEIFHEADYGIHSLSYPIKKVNQGRYFFYHFRNDGKSIVNIEKELHYEASILRFLIVRLDDITSKNIPEKIKEEKNEEEFKS